MPRMRLCHKKHGLPHLALASAAGGISAIFGIGGLPTWPASGHTSSCEGAKTHEAGRPLQRCFTQPGGSAARSAGSSSLLVLGLNPSQQTIARLHALELGQVNRAKSSSMGVGGKGQNAAKAASLYIQHKASEKDHQEYGVSVGQFLGGDTGAFVERHLTSLAIDQITGWVQPATRQTITLIDEQGSVGSKTCEVTELVMPSYPPEPEEVASLLEKLKKQARSQRGLLLMGTWPKGVDWTFYSDVAGAKAEGAYVLLDAFRPVEDIEKILTAGHVDIYKVNAFELCTLMGEDNVKEGSVSSAQIMAAASKALQKFPALRYLAITNGPDAAYCFARNGTALEFTIPAVTCINPIGAGDTFAGVFTTALCISDSPDVGECMRDGLAASSAKVQSEGEGGVFDLDIFQQLIPTILVKEMSATV
mmetsp:Transcript_58956/g.140753  ORF Transcript_58956/g.140753 Transcript_58956/m.140753 type:complete len:420 (-) Transcript_58956:25-1284(-)